jgi:CRP-like cAMP-binding protein
LRSGLRAERHEEFALFRTLSAEQRLTIFNAMTRQDLLRGRLLVEQGTSSDALFLVLNGALAVYRKDHVGLPSSAGLPTLIGQQIVHRLAIAFGTSAIDAFYGDRDRAFSIL